MQDWTMTDEVYVMRTAYACSVSGVI